MATILEVVKIKPERASINELHGSLSPNRGSLEHASLDCGGHTSSEVSEQLHTGMSRRHALIIEHRESARKIARKLLRRWNVQMDPEEADSLTDLALCKAARHFSPEAGAQFLTYCFHYLRGVIIRAISRSVSEHRWVIPEDAMAGVGESGLDIDSGTAIAASEERIDSSFTPERQVFINELRDRYQRVLLNLSSFERKVISEVQLNDTNVACLARKMGYSRGHVSKVKNEAIRKMQPWFEDLKQAA